MWIFSILNLYFNENNGIKLNYIYKKPPIKLLAENTETCLSRA